MLAKNTPQIQFEANSFDQLPHIQAQLQRDEAEKIVDDWLRRRGWKHSSDNPGCIWLWEKTFDGTSVRLNEDMAAWMQREMDCNDYFRQHPEEMGD
jgi:hypothetical protein